MSIVINDDTNLPTKLHEIEQNPILKACVFPFSLPWQLHTR